MTPATYQQLALVTESVPPWFRLLHAHLGLSSELEELGVALFEESDPVNLIEECGDFLWYAAIFVDALEAPMDLVLEVERVPSPDRDTSALYREIVSSTGLIADQLKKHIFYGKELARLDMLACLHGIMGALDDLLVLYTTTRLAQCMAPNIAKLKARYKGKFNASAALNRDLAEEREALEVDANQPRSAVDAASCSEADPGVTGQ